MEKSLLVTFTLRNYPTIEPTEIVRRRCSDGLIPRFPFVFVLVMLPKKLYFQGQAISLVNTIIV